MGFRLGNKYIMKLTVVTATFNCIRSGNGDNLIRCIESVAKLKTPHEHLIYDGASNDDTVDLLKIQAAKYPTLRFVSEPDTGIYNALNKGVRDAQGEWFYVLGADDYVCNPEVMDRLIAQEDIYTRVVVAPVMRVDGPCLYKSINDLQNIFSGYPYSHQSLIMKTDDVRKYGGFDEEYTMAADWIMQMHCHLDNMKFHYTENPFAYYAAGGFSENPANRNRYIHDYRGVHKLAMGIEDKEFDLFISRGFPRIKTISRLLKHRDFAFHLAAKKLMHICIKYYLRIVFYPIVLIKRQIVTTRTK